MRRPTLALLVALAGLLLPMLAQATIRTETVKLRRVGPLPTLRPGQPATLTFELLTARPVMVANLEASSKSLARALPRRAIPMRLSPEAPMRLELEVLPTERPEPLVVRYEVDGVRTQRTIDLTPLLESEREKASALVRIEDPGVPQGAQPITKPRPERPLPTGDDDPEVVPMPPAPAASAYDRIVTVRGRLAYLRDDGIMVGVDRIWVRVMARISYFPDKTIASGYSDNQGRFSLTYVGDPVVPGAILPDIYVKFETESPEVTVQTTGLETDYSWNTPTNWDYAGSDLNIGTWLPADQATHGALHIYTNIQHDWDWYWYQQSFAMPKVDVQWPEDESGAYYDRFWEEIHIGTDRTWREDTHAHEFGHHWVNNFANATEPDYCNNVCDTGSCGHCIWCPETDHDAYNEGWPNWISFVQTSSYLGTYGLAPQYTRDQEKVETCSNPFGFSDPFVTEGFIGAILQDIWDGANETDPNGFGQSDVLALGTEEIFEVADIVEPSTPLGFLNAFRARFPQYTTELWKVALNNRLQIDQALPTTPTNLTSSTHTPGVASLTAQVVLQWTGSTDDWSGIAGYDLLIDYPSSPDVVFNLSLSTLAGTGYLPPGTYMLGIRARDRAGRVSNYVMAGPYVIIAPDPVNLAFSQPAGWARPVVPRPDNTSTTSNVPNPASLIGDSPSTYFNAAFTNTGQTVPAILSASNSFCVDNTCGYSTQTAAPNPGQVITRINRGPINVRGGRHVIGMYLDRLATWVESNEFDNTWSHPWVFQPLTLTANTPLQRIAPPGVSDGWQMVRDGSAFFANCDGLRMSTSGLWNAAWIAGVDDTTDYDLNLHFTTSSPDTGFAAKRGYSMRGPGELDLVLVNKNVLTQPAWDLGVTSSQGDIAPYVIRHTPSTAMNYGDSVLVAWPDSDYVILRSVSIASKVKGSVVATGNPADGPFWVAFLDYNFSSAGLSGGGITLQPSDSTGRVRILFDLELAGPCAVLVVRDPAQGRAARSIVLEIEATPPNPMVAKTTGWHSGLVPRAAADGTDALVAAPDTLIGQSSSTYLNMRAANGGPIASPVGVGYQVRLDGAPLFTSTLPKMNGSVVFMHHGVSPVFVGGGRHSLSVALDHLNQYQELDEADNIWGEQWVWSPWVLPQNTPVAWPPVAPRAAGWNEMRAGEPLFFNSLGVRTPAFAPGGARWADVAMMPGLGNDLDLQLHAPAAGTKAGFQAALAVSAWSTQESEYLLYDTSGPQAPVYDVGLVNVDGVQQSPSVELKRALTQPVGTIGPRTLAANHTLDLHEVALMPGNYHVRLLVNTAGVNLGVSVHAPSPAVQTKSDALDASWGSGGGVDEEFIFTATTAGTFAFTVWKVARPDLAYAANYTLEITPTLVAVEDDAGITTNRLHFVTPNPFRTTTTVGFDLAVEGEATLELFDLAGARVATLASGHRAAGRHRIQYDDRGGDGHSLSAGVYFVRLSTPGYSSTRRVVRLP